MAALNPRCQDLDRAERNAPAPRMADGQPASPASGTSSTTGRVRRRLRRRPVGLSSSSTGSQRQVAYYRGRPPLRKTCQDLRLEDRQPSVSYKHRAAAVALLKDRPYASSHHPQRAQRHRQIFTDGLTLPVDRTRHGWGIPPEVGRRHSGRQSGAQDGLWLDAAAVSD
jgi:hypothetical protein